MQSGFTVKYVKGGCKLGVTLKFGDVELVKGQDFMVSYKDRYTNNIKKGNASVKIRGLGDYGGTKTVKFKIQAKKMESFIDIVRKLISGAE